jgi:hypothetical protein
LQEVQDGTGGAIEAMANKQDSTGDAPMTDELVTQLRVRVREDAQMWGAFDGPPSTYAGLTGEVRLEVSPQEGYEVVVRIPGRGEPSFFWRELIQI